MWSAKPDPDQLENTKSQTTNHIQLPVWGGNVQKKVKEIQKRHKDLFRFGMFFLKTKMGHEKT